MEINLIIKVKNYTVSVPRVKILLTCINEGSKMDESDMYTFFLQGLKPEFAQLEGP